MERLTTNKEKSEMGMYELAHNCCYYKDGEAIYQDFEMEMSARDFARNLMLTLCDEDMPVDDDLFDEEILENLQYDPFSTQIGLIALFYRNLWAMADLRERLKQYEDAEEKNKYGKTVDKKILPEYFEAIFDGRKKFEIRKDEDNIQIGDIVILNEWDGRGYTGRRVIVKIKYILRDCKQYGLEDGYCIFGW